MDDERTDIELIACLASDPVALETFYRRHRQRIVAYAVRRCEQPADIADLVAATFLAAMQSAHRFDERKGAPIAWLVGIAARQWWAISRNDRKQQRLRFEMPSRSLTDDDLTRLEEQLDAARETVVIEAAFKNIDPRHRELLWLISYDDLSYQEAANVLGISPGALRVRLLRARRALRLALAKQSPNVPCVRVAPWEA